MMFSSKEHEVLVLRHTIVHPDIYVCIYIRAVDLTHCAMKEFLSHIYII